MCLRSLLCCFLTLITTTTNLGVILGLNGEPAWIFLLCCNLDVVFSVLIRRWVTLKGPQSASTSCSPEEAMVDESSVAAPSFSSSQTAQNMHAEVSHRELVMDQNGKIIEVEVQREATAEGATDVEDELSLQFSPTSPKPPNSLSTDKFCFSGLDLKDDGFEDEDDDEEPPEQQQQQEIEAESIGRAIITTHISAQKMHDADFDGCFRLNQGDSFLDIDAAGKMKLGGIRVMIEQVVEVEYESDNGL